MPVNTKLPPIDFNKVWDSGIAFLSTIDIAAGVANLATMRSSGFPPSGASPVTPDPMYLPPNSNPVWRVKQGPFDMSEDFAPLICLDIDREPHDRPRDSGDNYHQEWLPEFLLMIVARGGTRFNAERRAMDVFSVLGQSWMGLGAKFGDPSIATKTGMQTTWFVFGSIQSETRDEGIQSIIRASVPIDTHFVMTRT